MSETNTLPAAPVASPSRWPTVALAAGVGAAFLGVGLAAGLMLRGPAPVNSATQADTSPQALTFTAPTQPPMLVEQREAPRHAEGSPAATRTATAPQAAATTGAEHRQQAAAVCATCGMIESVRPVQQKGQGTGLGAVAGGVLGGVVGNSMGGGSGKTALTVLGAIGGGVAGNEVEKHARGTTAYEVHVRMDDGSLRTFTRQSAPAAGARVTVEGHTFRTIGNGNANTGEPRVMQTSGQGPA